MLLDPAAIAALFLSLYGVGFAVGLFVQVLHLGRR